MTYQTLWDEPNAVPRENVIALNVYIGQREVSEINDLNFHFSQKSKSELNQRKKILRVEINKI